MGKWLFKVPMTVEPATRQWERGPRKKALVGYGYAPTFETLQPGGKWKNKRLVR